DAAVPPGRSGILSHLWQYAARRAGASAPSRVPRVEKPYPISKLGRSRTDATGYLARRRASQHSKRDRGSPWLQRSPTAYRILSGMGSRSWRIEGGKTFVVPILSACRDGPKSATVICLRLRKIVAAERAFTVGKRCPAAGRAPTSPNRRRRTTRRDISDLSC